MQSVRVLGHGSDAERNGDGVAGLQASLTAAVIAQPRGESPSLILRRAITRRAPVTLTKARIFAANAGDPAATRTRSRIEVRAWRERRPNSSSWLLPVVIRTRRRIRFRTVRGHSMTTSAPGTITRSFGQTTPTWPSRRT